MKKSIFAAGIALATLTGANAYGAAISIDTFDLADFNAATTGGTIESFETYGGGAWDNSNTTSVGTFSALSGFTGNGSVCNAQTGGSCTGLAINNQVLSGQGALIGSQALSSNDTAGILWEVSSSGSAFDRIVFAVRDAADISGTTFTIETGTGLISTLTAQSNNNQQLVVIDLGMSVTSATVSMSNNQANDGFTIDAASTVSSVPLPAAAWLFLSGLGVLGAIRKRKQNVA